MVIFSSRTPIKVYHHHQSQGKLFKLNGVGFKSFVFNQNITFQLGYSHYCLLKVPKSTIVRSHKNLVALKTSTNLAYKIENLRKPDAYKARGIHLNNLKPSTKEGKRR